MRSEIKITNNHDYHRKASLSSGSQSIRLRILTNFQPIKLFFENNALAKKPFY